MEEINVAFGLVAVVLFYGVVSTWERYLDGYYKRLDKWHQRFLDIATDLFTPIFKMCYYVFIVGGAIFIMSFFFGWPLSW